MNVESDTVGPPRHRPRTRRRKAAYAVTVVMTLLFLLAVAGESVIRWRRGAGFSLSRVGWKAREVLSPDYLAAFDDQLGYVPTRNDHGQWKDVHESTDADGLRRNVESPPPPGRPILAAGDSFTWGTGVNDDATWPAHAERLLGRRVLNAGVFGYGLDQIVLRAERLIPRFEPEVLIVAIIADDVSRCEYAYRSAWRPYFVVHDDALHLRGVPVVQAPPPEPKASHLRSLLTYSHLADALCMRWVPAWWLSDRGIKQVHRQGEAVSCLLMRRLRELGDTHGVKVMFVVIQGTGRDRRRVEPVLAEARKQRLVTLDLAPTLAAMVAEDPGLTVNPAQGVGHLSGRGNAWVAERIVATLREQKLIRPDGDAASPAM